MFLPDRGEPDDGITPGLGGPVPPLPSIRDGETPVPALEDAPDPALAESRYWLRWFFAMLVVLCVALIAGDYHETRMAMFRGVFLVGAVVFGSVALMPARKLENIFLRPPGSASRLNAAPAEEPDEG